MGSSYRLALDLGIASIGWALLETDASGNLFRILRTGTHLFDSGDASAFERGKDEPPAKPRRDARQLRKMIWRRARRKRKLLRLLQKAGLLPPGDVSTPAAIDAYMVALDAALAATWNVGVTHREHQLLPYRIRVKGLDSDLEPFAFGRALYHLAQRRGFLSNRKSREKADEKSVVKAGIGELAKEMETAGARTLGEYFASIDPEQIKLRRRWTSRAMYAGEFDILWSRQAAALGLSDDQRDAIRSAIFHQRPLKSTDHLIGRCRHLPGQRRAPMACRLAQRFRLLQKVNDLLLVPCEKISRTDVDKNGKARINPKTGKPKTKVEWMPTGDGRPLTAEERSGVLDALREAKTVTLADLRDRIDAPPGHRFNFETQDESSLPGHKTDATLAALMPDYPGWAEARKTALVDELLGELDDEQMRERLVTAYKLAPDIAEAVVAEGLEEAYAGVSREALRRLLPLMEQGMPYATARKEKFGEDEEKRPEPLDRLPPVLKHDVDLRNPTVLRGLTELRKLVNLIIKRYGKPQRIHIELLRELKKSRDARADIATKNEQRRKRRDAAAAAIVRDTGVARANGLAIEKWLLADECRWTCPYTGKPINVDSLFRSPQFEIEHIWPYAQSLDDSVANKTLCHRDANGEKGRRMPAQAFSEDRLAEIIGRVARFDGDLRDEKLRRFKATALPDGFSSRQLVDSSHIAKAASQYLGLLYGGVNDPELADGTPGTQRIHTRTGGLTAQLRRLWGLNGILSGTDQKTREDHRHHAIDAVVVGVADTRTVQELMRVASEQIRFGRSRLRDLSLPWEGFFHQLVEAADGIVVSHRQSRKIGGALHGGSNYSRLKKLDGRETHTIRKPVTALKPADLAKIVDPRIRASVEAALANSGAASPDRAFVDGKFPVWTRADGTTQPIKRVRITTDARPFTVGRAERARHVDSTQGSNHHARIIAMLAPDETEKTWRDEIVSRFEMHGRKSAGNINVDTAVGPNERFKFSLAANEYVELDDLDPDGNVVGRMLCRVLSVSGGDFEVVHHLDGRTSTERKEQKGRLRGGASWLLRRNARKVFVNYLGEVKNGGG